MLWRTRTWQRAVVVVVVVLLLEMHGGDCMNMWVLLPRWRNVETTLACIIVIADLVLVLVEQATR